MSPKTIFEKIINKEIPGTILYEDDECIVLKDINPQSPVHVLIIPKRVISRLAETKDTDKGLLGHLLIIAKEQSKKLGIENGYRLVINNGTLAGETVPHLHIHLLGGRPLNWPPG